MSRSPRIPTPVPDGARALGTSEESCRYEPEPGPREREGRPATRDGGAVGDAQESVEQGEALEQLPGDYRREVDLQGRRPGERGGVA